MYDETELKTKRTTKRLVVVLILIVIIIGGCISTPFILSLTVREYRTIKDIPAPTQVPISGGATSVAGSDWSATMIYLAEYDIRGLVVGVDDYDGSSLYDRMVPRDISIAWGDMAANNNLIFWQRGEREMNAEVNVLAELLIGKKYDELFRQYSNNHIIPKDDEILRQIKVIKRGDYVRLKGYLVEVKGRDRNEPGVYYQLTSSLTRDDNGDSSCEVMYVTDVELLD